MSEMPTTWEQRNPTQSKKLVPYNGPKENLLIKFWTRQENTEGKSKALCQKKEKKTPNIISTDSSAAMLKKEGKSYWKCSTLKLSSERRLKILLFLGLLCFLKAWRLQFHLLWILTSWLVCLDSCSNLFILHLL